MNGKILLTAVCLWAAQSFASDPSEQGVSTSPLKIYSAGFNVGGLVPMTDSLKSYSEGFAKLSFASSMYFRDNVSFFWDVNWYAPGANFGSDIGVDFNLLKGDVKPIIGGGFGVTYFDKSDEFGDNIGPSATLHAGVAFDLSESVQLRFMVPYQVVLNKTRDQLAGVQVGLLFSNRFKKVKKLDYNN